MIESDISTKSQDHERINIYREKLSGRMKKRDLENFLILLIYLSVHVYLVFHHEAWRDESQAWVIARNLSLRDILSICASEGHPCLWFFFLKACTILGISFYHFSLISTLIMTGAAAFLLWKSPFSLLSNLCILLSPVFFYYNPIICRIYSIVVFLCVILCTYWPRRRESPILYGILVAMIFQTHILMAGLAIGCFIEMVVNCKRYLKLKNIIGFLIPLASLVCMILELRQTEQTETFIRVDINFMMNRLRGGKIPIYFESITKKFIYEGIPVGIIFLWVSVLLIVFFVVCYIKNKKFRFYSKGVGIISFCGIAYYWSIIILVRSADHIQMAIVLWMLVLVLVWLATKAFKFSVENENKQISNNKSIILGNMVTKRIVPSLFELLFVFCSILAIPQTIGIDAISDVKGPFSGSREMVDLITNNAPENAVIVLHNEKLSTSIVSYLYDAGKNYTIWDIDNGEEYKVHKWGRKNNRTIEKESIYESICKDLQDKENVYFINTQQSIEFCDQTSEQMALIGQNSFPNIWNEYYQSYKVKLEIQ